MIKIKCDLCNQEISKSNYSKHLRRHELHPETFVKVNSFKHEGLNCIYCDKLCKNANSLRSHERTCKCNPDRFYLANYTKAQNGHVAWNKGLTKETDERIAKAAEKFKSNYIAGLFDLSTNNPVHRPEVKEKLRQKALANIESGKVIPICRARGKKGYYHGIWCDSSWELAFLLYCQENNIEVIRNSDRFNYIFDEHIHIYVPDFYLPATKQYVEIKGYKDKKAKAKANQCYELYNIIEYNIENMQPILDFVKEKFGNEFYQLYDK